MRRGCMIFVLGALGLCVVGGVLGWLVGVPRLRDGLQDGVRDGIATEVANQIPADAGGEVPPGRYTFTEGELQAGLADEAGDQVEDVLIDLSPTGIRLGFVAQGDQELNYRGLPAAENGRFVVQDMEATNGLLDFVFPADDLAAAIEDAVNGYLTESGLRLQAVELGEGELTLETEPA